MFSSLIYRVASSELLCKESSFRIRTPSILIIRTQSQLISILRTAQQIVVGQPHTAYMRNDILQCVIPLINSLQACASG